MKPVLSILIATKNRVPYCINAIETILKFEDSDFELIIQDNTDSLELFEYAQIKVTEKRFKYNYTPPPFSSIANFNAAIEMASGEYLCLIGDDDGINPEIFKLTKWALQNNIDAILPELKAYYAWPDACNIFRNCKSHNGFLRIDNITGNVKEFDTTKEVHKLLKNGGQGYLNLNLPKLYHGIVKKEILENVKAVTGFYIGGLSPDIYTSVALTAFVKRIIKIDYPLTISGICIVSTSADSRSGKHEGKFEDIPHLRERGQYFWSDQVPKFYSVETIWADSAIASLKDLNRLKLLSKFDIEALTVLVLKKHKGYSKVILRNYFENKNSSNFASRICYLVLLFIKYAELVFFNIIPLVISKLKNKTKTIFRSGSIEKINLVSLNNIMTINQATDQLQKHLLRHSLSIDSIINKLDILLDNRSEKNEKQ